MRSMRLSQAKTLWSRYDEHPDTDAGDFDGNKRINVTLKAGEAD